MRKVLAGIAVLVCLTMCVAENSYGVSLPSDVTLTSETLGYDETTVTLHGGIPLVEVNIPSGTLAEEVLVDSDYRGLTSLSTADIDMDGDIDPTFRTSRQPFSANYFMHQKESHCPYSEAEVSKRSRTKRCTSVSGSQKILTCLSPRERRWRRSGSNRSRIFLAVGARHSRCS